MVMVDDFNKRPPLHDQTAITQKKRIPVYILILVGIFLLAVLFYMFADVKPDAPATQPNTPVPATEAPANNASPATTPGGESNEAMATVDDAMTEATATVGEMSQDTAEATATDAQQATQ